jgi:hypothetical protein
LLQQESVDAIDHFRSEITFRLQKLRTRQWLSGVGG